MQVQRVTKGNMPISIFGLQTIGAEKLPLTSVATTDIKETYSIYKKDLIGIHTHDFYLVSWITEGHCSYNLEMDLYKIFPNTILLLKPGELHYFSNVVEVEGINFYFTPDILSHIDATISTKIEVELFTLNHIIPVTFDKTTEMLKTYSDRLSSACKDGDGSVGEEIRKLEMLVFLLKLLECEEVQNKIKTNAENRNSYSIFLQFQKMVDDNYQSLHKVQEYSRLLNISPKHLAACVRKNAGRSPLRIINQRLILQSQRLLLFSRLRIKEIAMSLGFVDTSHFVKFFKKEMGATPSQYREKGQRNEMHDAIAQ